MKDKSRHHAYPNGNDCASPPIRNNAEGENHQRGQQGNFDKGFHRQNMRLQPSAFQSPWLSDRRNKKAPGSARGFSVSQVSRDQYFAMTGPPKR